MENRTGQTIKAYDNNALGYLSKFKNFDSYIQKITHFQSYIPSEAQILDVGCGPGNNARRLLDLDSSYMVEGYDLSKEMIALAEKNVPEAHFQIADIRQLALTNRYDSIIASFCIVHLSDDDTKTLLQKIAEHLVPGGILYLSFMEGKKSGMETTSFSSDEIFFNYYDREHISSLLIQNDLNIFDSFCDDYHEEDGTVTNDIFIFARKRESGDGE